MLSLIDRLSARGWTPTLVCAVAFALLSPALGAFMNTRRSITYGAALGMTILVWVIAYHLAEPLRSGSAPSVQATPIPTRVPVAAPTAAAPAHPPQADAGSRGSKERGSSAPTVIVHGNNAVISQGQTGGITAQSVIISPAQSSRDATLRIGTVKQEARPDGLFQTSGTFLVESPFPVANLYIEVHGQSIESLEVRPNRGGVFITGHSGKREGFAFTNIPNASGQYELRVVSKVAEQFTVNYDVE